MKSNLQVKTLRFLINHLYLVWFSSFVPWVARQSAQCNQDKDLLYLRNLPLCQMNKYTRPFNPQCCRFQWQQLLQSHQNRSSNPKYLGLTKHCPWKQSLDQTSFGHHAWPKHLSKSYKGFQRNLGGDIQSHLYCFWVQESKLLGIFRMFHQFAWTKDRQSLRILILRRFD